jgi:hypothetical protein
MPKMTRFCARNAGLCAVLRRIATVGLASIFSFKHLIINILSTYSGRKMHRERGILWDWGVGGVGISLFVLPFLHPFIDYCAPMDGNDVQGLVNRI